MKDAYFEGAWSQDGADHAKTVIESVVSDWLE
jgi:hypothetical protein